MHISFETLCAAQRGDTDAQTQLMVILYKPVYHFLLKRTGSKETADELCQTVFLKCYQRLNHYDSAQGTVYTWVFTIARNTLIDFFKKRKDEQLDNPEELVNENPYLNAEHQAETRENTAYIQELLSKLEDEEADVVTLRAINEMPYETIAGIINKKESTVRKMYSRALKKLKLLVSDQSQLAYE